MFELDFIAGRDDDTDFLYARIKGFLADDLDNGFGEAVAVDHRQEFFLDDGGGGVHAGAAAGGGDDGFANISHGRGILVL